MTPTAPASFWVRAEQFLIWLGTQIDGLLRRREVAFGLGAALILVLLVGGVWLLRLPQNSPAQRAARDEPGVVTDAAAGDEGAAVPTGVDGGQEGETAVPNPTAETETALADSPPAFEIFLPLTELGLAAHADTAVLQTVNGVVEVQTADGRWQLLPRQTTLAAGQRIRTGALSLATLTFYDGSQATVHASSELSIDQLNAQRPEVGFRTVVLTQHVGESAHNVQFRSDGGSVYQVNTPAGSGVARGTQFQVVVTRGVQPPVCGASAQVD